MVKLAGEPIQCLVATNYDVLRGSLTILCRLSDRAAGEGPRRLLSTTLACGKLLRWGGTVSSALKRSRIRSYGRSLNLLRNFMI